MAHAKDKGAKNVKKKAAKGIKEKRAEKKLKHDGRRQIGRRRDHRRTELGPLDPDRVHDVQQHLRLLSVDGSAGHHIHVDLSTRRPEPEPNRTNVRPASALLILDRILESENVRARGEVGAQPRNRSRRR